MHALAARLTLLFVLAAGVAGCAAREDEPGAAERTAAAAWVGAARGAHAAADAALERGDHDAARTALRAAWDRPAPPAVSTEDVRVVKQDLAYRLAEVELGAGEPARALAWTDRGLEQGRARDLFTANLLVARGRAQEALGNETEAAGSYFEALEINDDLLRRTLGEGER